MHIVFVYLFTYSSQVLASEWGKLSTPLGGAFGSSNSSAMGPGLGLGNMGNMGNMNMGNMGGMSVLGSGGLTAAALGSSKGMWFISYLLFVHVVCFVLFCVTYCCKDCCDCLQKACLDV